MKKMSLAFVAIFSAFLLAGCWNTGGSQKIGNIVKFGKSGAICKTYEAEILRGGINNGTGAMGNSFHFTIEDDALAAQVEAAMNSGREVKITYKTELVSLCRSDSNNVFLTKIEYFDPSQGSGKSPQVAIPQNTPSSVTAARDASTLDKQKLAEQIIRQNDELIKIMKN